MPAASKPRLIPCDLDLAAWVAHPPSAAEVRPKHCPACEAPSRPLGRPLGIRGHGSRACQVRGPLQPDGPWVTVTIRARRFLCRCGAAMLVVPAGVLAHRRYSAPALYGLERLAPGRMRAHVTGPADAADWPSLRRWCQQVRAGALPHRPPHAARLARPARRRAGGDHPGGLCAAVAWAAPPPAAGVPGRVTLADRRHARFWGRQAPTNTERFTGNCARSRQVPASAAGAPMPPPARVGIRLVLACPGIADQGHLRRVLSSTRCSGSLRARMRITEGARNLAA